MNTMLMVPFLVALPFMNPPVKAEADAVSAAVESVDEDRWIQTIQELAGELPLSTSDGSVTLESRHSSSRGNTLAGTHIFETLAEMGFEVSYQNFESSTGVERNIIAVKTGTARRDEVYVVGAHYDSTCQDPEKCLGADDNASGVATMLEVAEIMSQFETEATLHFVAFGAEEQGLDGSSAYVDLAQEENWNIRGAATIDMVGWYDRQFKLVVEGKLPYLPWMNEAVDAANDYADVDVRRSMYSFGSDHIPFQQANIPAFLLIEQEWYKAPHYHTNDDTFDVIRPELGLEATKMLVGLMGTVAGLSRSTGSSALP